MVATREELRAIAEAVLDLDDGEEYTAESARAFEVKRGLFRVEIVTANGQPNRVGLFTKNAEGEVIPAA